MFRCSLVFLATIIAISFFNPVAANTAGTNHKNWPLECRASFLPEKGARILMQRHLDADGNFVSQDGYSRADGMFGFGSRSKIDIRYPMDRWDETPPNPVFDFSRAGVKEITARDSLNLAIRGGETHIFPVSGQTGSMIPMERNALLALLPDEGAVVISLKRQRQIGKGQRTRASGRISAKQLKAELLALPDLQRKLDEKQADYRRRCLAGEDIVENPQAPIWCPVQFFQDGIFYMSNGNLHAQVPIGKSMYMNISRGFYKNAPAQAFVDQGLDAFAELKWFVHATIFNRRSDAYKQEHRLEILNGEDRIDAKAIGDRVDYKILRKWDARSTATIFKLIGKDGNIIEVTRFSPGALKQIENRLRSTVAAGLKKRENPYENCEPPQEIIVT